MNPFFAAFARHLAERPDAHALGEDDLILSFSHLDAASDAIARRILDEGCAPGDIVPFLGEPGLNRIVVFLGALKAGVVFILLDPEHPIPALRNVTEHAEAKAAIVDSEAMAGIAKELGLKPVFAPLPWPDRASVPPFERREPPADQPAYIRYTSGSTGRPKGVAYTWALTNAACDRMDILTPTKPGERAALLRQFWPVHALAVLRAGGMLDFFDLPGHGGQAMLHWLRERRINQIRTFTAVLRAMQVERNVVLPDLRYATFAGEALLRADAEYFDAISTPGARLVNFYSATEHQAVSYLVHEHGAPIPYDSVPLGIPTEPGEIWVVDENANPVPDGVEGEFVISSPYIPTGYYREPEQTAKRFRPFAPAGGRLAYFTGDRGKVGLDGLLHTAGRADDQIKIRGYALRPSEIEQVLLDHPGVAKVAVVGFDGPKGIKRLACHYIPAGEPAPSGADLRAYLGGLLPAYMVPTAYMRHETFPTTDTGKVLRRALPDPLAAVAESQRGLEAARTEAERTVAAAWTEVLGHGDFSVDDDFFDVGGDSLQAMAMLVALEKHFPARVPLETLILDGASVESLAARFTGAAALGVSPTTAMNRGGAGTPVYAIHVMGGHLSDYLEIAHAWEGVRPLVGVRPRGLDGRTQPAATAMEAGADAARAIRGHQAEGPYTVMGFSAGAVFAAAAARALQDDGQAVTLVLLDPPPPKPEALRWPRTVWRALRDKTLGLAWQRLRQVLAGLAGGRVAPAQIDEAHLWAVINRELASVQPQATLIVTSEETDSAARLAEWRALLGPGAALLARPGDHMGMINGERGRDLALAVHGWLRQHEGAEKAGATARVRAAA